MFPWYLYFSWRDLFMEEEVRVWNSQGGGKDIFFSTFLSIEWVSEVTQSCQTLCDRMDYSLPGSSIHGDFQGRTLEWAAISRGSSPLRDHTWVSSITGRFLTLWATREEQRIILRLSKDYITTMYSAWEYILILLENLFTNPVILNFVSWEWVL